MPLFEYLQIRGLTAYAYAREMNVSDSAVARWLKGGWMVFGGDLVSPKRETKPLEEGQFMNYYEIIAVSVLIVAIVVIAVKLLKPAKREWGE